MEFKGMKFKTIKPGMVIRCRDEEESRTLLEYLEEFTEYRWTDGDLPTCHYIPKGDNCFHVCDNWIINSNKSFYYEKRNFEITAFSDLIEPEISIKKSTNEKELINDSKVFAENINSLYRDSHNDVETSVLRVIEIVQEALAYRRGREIIPRRCDNCTDFTCIGCKDYETRCPTCGISLPSQHYQPDYCSGCGQKLIWPAQNGQPCEDEKEVTCRS